MIFCDPWWNSAKDAATCSLWLSAAASCRVQRLGWLVKLYDPTFFNDELMNMWGTWWPAGQSRCSTLYKLYQALHWWYESISRFFGPICFLRTTPMHAWPNANLSWVFGGGFERIYFAAIRHTRIACMHTQAGTYTNIIITKICICTYIYI